MQASRRAGVAGLILLIAVAAAVRQSGATATYQYRKNELAIIESGLSPDKRYSVAAHGEGEYGSDDFHLYLMREPGHRKIGVLEEVGPDILDSAPDAYSAAWSADSRHVAIHYRADRHMYAMVLYRIDGGRAVAVTGPNLFDTVSKQATRAQRENWRVSSVSLTWLGANRFRLKERRYFEFGTPALAQSLGEFGRTLPAEKGVKQTDPPRYEVEFSAEAECDLAARNSYRIISVKPGAFRDRQ